MDKSRKECPSGLETDVFIELHIPDFDRAISFYNLLGFEVCWREDGPGGYLVMKKGRSVINFYGGTQDVSNHNYFMRFPVDTPRGYGVEIIILEDDIESLYNHLKISLNCIIDALTLRPWGRKDFRLVDPFGFYLRFCERYNWIDRVGHALESA